VDTFERFLNDVQKINNTYNKSYLEAEYNQVVQSTQMAVKWNDFAKDGDDYNLQYRTAGDEKVRASHAALNEISLPFSDPFWSAYLPPNGWNCRCTVEQVRKEKYPVSDSKEAIETGNFITDAPKDKIFRFNPGKEMKLFPDKHPYYKTKDADTIHNQAYILQAYKQAGEFNLLSKKIAEKNNVLVTPVNLKDRDRIIEKAADDYQGNIEKVRDIIRNTFIVESEKFLSKAKQIIDNFDVVGDVKYQDTPEGYTGILFNTRINGIVAECQINTPQMIYGKQKNSKDILTEDIYVKLDEEAKKQGISGGKGHDYYKEIRSLDDEKNKEEIKKLREESKEYYKKIRGLKIKTSDKK